MKKLVLCLFALISVASSTPIKELPPHHQWLKPCFNGSAPFGDGKVSFREAMIACLKVNVDFNKPEAQPYTCLFENYSDVIKDGKVDAEKAKTSFEKTTNSHGKIVISKAFDECNIDLTAVTYGQCLHKILHSGCSDSCCGRKKKRSAEKSSYEGTDDIIENVFGGTDNPIELRLQAAGASLAC